MSEKEDSAQAIEAATKRVQELLNTERRLAARLAAAAEQTATTEAATSAETVAALLAGGEADDEDGLAQVLMLQARERDTRRAVDAVRVQRGAAIRELYRAEADRCQQRAGVLRAEATERQTRVDRLLDEVAELEGVRYAPSEGLSGRPGSPTFVRVPKTEDLRIRAATLESEAQSWLQRDVPAGGEAFADDVDALVEQACYAVATVIGPTEEATRRWAAGVIADELARRSRFMPGMARYIQPDAVVHLRLSWQQGEIVPKRSGVEPPSTREWFTLRRAAGRSIEEAAADLNLHASTARAWARQPGPDASGDLAAPIEAATGAG